MNLLSLLLFPQLSFNLYVALIIFLSFFNIIRFRSHNLFFSSVKLFYPFYILFFLTTVLSCLRYFLNISSVGNLKDIIDCVRFLFFPAAYICMYGTSRESAVRAVVLFFLLDFIVSNMQFFKINYFGLIDFFFDIYNYSSIKPWVYGDYGIVRAPGLFSGFGEHGLFLFFFILFVYINFRLFKKSVAIILIFMALEVLLINQSRTIIVALGVVFLFYWIVSFLSLKNVILNLFILFVLVFVLFSFSSELSYLKSILDSGLDAGAMKSRFDKWEYFMSYWMNYAYLLFGAGRELVGNQAVYDNEFVYMITTFGLLISILYYIFVVRLMISDGMLLCTVCYLLFLMISGFGIISISQPQLVVFLTLFYFSKKKYFLSKV